MYEVHVNGQVTDVANTLRIASILAREKNGTVVPVLKPHVFRGTDQCEFCGSFRTDADFRKGGCV